MGTSPAPQQDLTAQVERVREDLRREFPTLPEHVVDRAVRHAEADLRQARITTYVPTLVRRAARDGLRHLTHG